MDEHALNPDCKTRFEKIETRLEKGDEELKTLDKSIAVLDVKQEQTQKQLSIIASALWAITLLVLGALVYFVFWYIENKK
jgi:hypothetical protein